MDDNTGNLNPHLLQLVLSLHAGNMTQLGKVASPLTGQVERNLAAAKETIDTLAMLETKMKGNLHEDEQKLISHALTEMRLNYVDESQKPEQAESDQPEPAQDKPEDSNGAEEKPGN